MCICNIHTYMYLYVYTCVYVHACASSHFSSTVLDLPQVPPSPSPPSTAIPSTSTPSPTSSLSLLCLSMSRDSTTYPPITLPHVPSFRVCCDRCTPIIPTQNPKPQTETLNPKP